MVQELLLIIESAEVHLEANPAELVAGVFESGVSYSSCIR